MYCLSVHSGSDYEKKGDFTSFHAFNWKQGYRISANSFRGNYSFLEVGVRQLFKGGNYSREETIVFLVLCKNT